MITDKTASTLARRPRKPRRVASGDSVRADEVLTKSALLSRLGWGERTYRHAIRDGLRVTRYGGMIYVSGRDVLAFFDQQSQEGKGVTTRLTEGHGDDRHRDNTAA